MSNSQNGRRTSGGIVRWFHPKDSNSSSVKKKEKARLENAHMHAVLSVAGLAAALAAVTAAENSNGSSSKMSMALASATELLASHCLEMAESAGAEHDRVASVVRSAVDIHSASDLVTFTAAAATGTYLLVNCYVLANGFELFIHMFINNNHIAMNEKL